MQNENTELPTAHAPRYRSPANTEDLQSITSRRHPAVAITIIIVRRRDRIQSPTKRTVGKRLKIVHSHPETRELGSQLC